MKTSISIIDVGTPQMPFVLRGDYKDSIQTASSLGFDAVEMHIRNPEKIDVDQIREYCASANIKVSSIGTGLSYGLDGLSFMSSDEENRRTAVNRMIKYIWIAKELDAVIIIGLMKGLISEEGYDICINRLKESLCECLAQAEINKVTIVLEVINRYESNFLTKIEETTCFVKAFDSKYLKVHIDTYHMNIEEPDLCESIRKCKGLLGHVHIADSDRMYPGHAHIPFDKLFKTLKEIGYDRYLAVECLALPDPLECAKKSAVFLKQFNL
jgi:sugar phosphate isomerase/epimerase